jgi:protein-tyrosine phosphatase
MFQILQDAVHGIGRRIHARVSKQARRNAAVAHHARVMRKLAAGAKPQAVLFLCHGNICRSPAAQFMARDKLRGVVARSAGFAFNPGRCVPAHVLSVAGDVSAAMAGHTSRRVTAADIRVADLILCMDLENLHAVRREFPEAMARSTLLGLFGVPRSVEISDPIAFSAEATAEVLREIGSAIEGLEVWVEREFHTAVR